MAAMLFFFQGAADQRGLGTVEAGHDAAGHGDKEDRDEGQPSDVPDKAARFLRIGRDPVRGGGQQALEVAQVDAAIGEHANQHGNGGHDQEGAEDGIDAADDLVNGEDRGQDVVHKDQAVHQPQHPVGGGGGLLEDVANDEVAGGVHENHAHQHQQDAGEPQVDGLGLVAQVLGDDAGHLRAAVAGGDHAVEVVMHRAGQHAANGDGNQGNRPKQNALDGAQHRAGARDVEQVDQGVLPGRHRHIVHVVALRVRGGGPVIRAKLLLDELAV